MRLIVITSPDAVVAEVECLRVVVECGADLLHVRKPSWSLEQVRRLLDALPESVLQRVVIHDHHALAAFYPLYGVHLNGRHPVVEGGVVANSVSRSCHSLEEVRQWAPLCDHVFLSPIFDSISKTGYHSAFSPAELSQASSQGIIGSGVIALGGCTLDTIPALCSWGFGGAAFLGAVWRHAGSSSFAPTITALRRALDLVAGLM